jgi:Tfp pilus assembly protein PilN
LSREAKAWAELADRAAALLLPELASRVQAAARRKQAQARMCRVMAVSALVLTIGVNGVLLLLDRSASPGAERQRAFLAEQYELLSSL